MRASTSKFNIAGRVLRAATILSVLGLVVGCVPSTSTSTTQGFTVNDLPWSGATTYLVDGNGRTLYSTTRDAEGKSNIAGTALATWPVFYAPTIVVPTTLKAASFSTITRADGTKQTTFATQPLYYYSGDRAPGDMRGDGVDGVWHVVGVLYLGGPTSTTTPATTVTTIQGTVTTIPEDADRVVGTPGGNYAYEGNLSGANLIPTVNLDFNTNGDIIHINYRAEIETTRGKTRNEIISIYDNLGQIRVNQVGTHASVAGGAIFTVVGLPPGINCDPSYFFFGFNISNDVSLGSYPFSINVITGAGTFSLPGTIIVN